MKAGGQYVVNPLALLEDMSPRVLGIWRALHEIDPWDENRADKRAAIVAASVWRAGGYQRADGLPFELDDFMPHASAQREPEVIERARVERVEERVRSGLRAFSGHKAKNYLNISEDDDDAGR